MIFVKTLVQCSALTIFSVSTFQRQAFSEKLFFPLDQTSHVLLKKKPSFFSILVLYLSRISKLGCKFHVFRRLSSARMGKAIVLTDSLSLVEACVIYSAYLV